ncbi:hypothetical protein [Vibrio gallaecicus]|uniref:Uncharacterized protein n=1 Tax=Vibrio gallaecicus TaxID=552386 RepID=A0ABV4N9D6_9VIBR
MKIHTEKSELNKHYLLRLKSAKTQFEKEALKALIQLCQWSN